MREGMLWCDVPPSILQYWAHQGLPTQLHRRPPVPDREGVQCEGHPVSTRLQQSNCVPVIRVNPNMGWVSVLGGGHLLGWAEGQTTIGAAFLQCNKT